MNTYPSPNYNLTFNLRAFGLPIIIAISISLFKPISFLCAQSYEFKNDRILTPEVTHFIRPNEPGVDAHGDLSLSVPLVTVPGRDGLNFDIAAYYRSGIQVKQSASWIGLGWSLDLGSITRYPLGGLENEPQVDFTLGVDSGGTALTSQPDVYTVHMNGSTVSLITITPTAILPSSPRLPFAPFKAPAEAGECGSGQTLTYNFVPSPWQPWKICYATESPLTVNTYETGILDVGSPNPTPLNKKADYSMFVITTEDGTRYVYGRPTLAEASFPDAQGEGTIKSYRFVSTWRLEAILSPNYAGNNLPQSDSPGGWVKITYKAKDQNNNLVEVHTAYQTITNIVSQVTYPYEVETPTHLARFETLRRYDRDLRILQPEQDFNLRLDKIKLYRKDPGGNILIKEVAFTYKANIALDNTSTANSMLSKLALQEIKITGFPGSQSLPSYKFDYYDTILSWASVTTSNQQLLDYQDDFGYYNNLLDAPNDADGRMWSLKEVLYPSGGRHTFEYENDFLNNTSLSYTRFYLGSYSLQSNNFVRLRQGGPRVKEIEIYDGFNATSPDLILFNYGPGHHSNIPELWFRKSGGFPSQPFHFSGERGQASVGYEWVEKTQMDGSKIRTEYVTETVTPQKAIFYVQSIQSLTVLQENTAWNWGEVTSVKYFANGGDSPVKEVTNSWTFEGVPSFALPLAQVTPTFNGDGNNRRFLYFTHKQLDTFTTKDYFGTNSITAAETYTYKDGTLLKTKTETSGDGKVRKTEYLYAHEITSPAEPYSTMKTKNRRSQVARASVNRNNDNTKGFASTINTWRLIPFKMVYQLLSMCQTKNIIGATV